MKKQSNEQESNLPKLAQPAQRALAAAGILNLKDLIRFSEAEIKTRHRAERAQSIARRNESEWNFVREEVKGDFGGWQK
jgi:hypothetical protein